MKAWLLVACGMLGGCALFKDGEKPPFHADFKGNEAHDAGTLKDALKESFEDYKRTTFKKAAVDDAAFELERFYRDSGFPFARVSYTYEEPEGARPSAVFEIDEGPRTQLERVDFEGNEHEKTKTLRAFFTPEAVGVFESRATWYVENDVRGKVTQMERYYRSRGYLDIYVEPPVVEFDDTRESVRVLIKLIEGVRYRLHSVHARGTYPDGRELDVRPLERLWKKSLGDVFRDRLGLEIQGTVEAYFADGGYPNVRVQRKVTRDPATAQVELDLVIEPGPEVEISGIRVLGNQTTDVDFIRSRLELEKGDLYDRAEEKKSAANLHKSGLFKRVELHLEPPSPKPIGFEREKRELVVDLEEAPSLETFVEPGWGSYEALRFTAGAREKSLFGSGRILDSKGSISRLAQSGKISLIDPWLFGSDVTTELSLFGNRREEPAFLRRELGSGITLSRRFSTRLLASLSYQYRLSDATDVDVFDPGASELADDVDISEISVTGSYDERDDVFRPTEGTFARVSLGVASDAIGSQLDFVRTRVTLAEFFDLNAATVLGASLRTGTIAPIGATDVIPLQERFFNGGENSVRSFQEGELGPMDADGTPVGGEAFTTFSLELRHRLRGRLEGAVFYDVGNVLLKHEDLFKFPDLREGIGVGLRYWLPVGPIRLDGALNPDPDGDEADGAVHFSVGVSF